MEKAITINRPISEVYSFWRQVENLPRFMPHLISVVPLSLTASHWTAQTAKGKPVEWDARIIEDKRDELIAWQSLAGSEVDSAGSVRFTPAHGSRGTVLKVALKYAPTGGKLGNFFATHFTRGAKKEIAASLFRLKSLLETGEMPTVQGQPQGNHSSDHKCL